MAGQAETAEEKRDRLRLVPLMALTAMVLPIAAFADTYQFIISGDPVAAAMADSRTVPSAATSLQTGTLSTPTAAVSMEARYRTWDDSDGIALRSDKFVATVIIVR